MRRVKATVATERKNVRRSFRAKKRHGGEGGSFASLFLPVFVGDHEMPRTIFRNRDRVTVHGFLLSNKEKKHRGRVICDNRKSRINHPIIILIDLGDTEITESFMTDGTRGRGMNDCYLTLGWENEGKKS